MKGMLTRILAWLTILLSSNMPIYKKGRARERNKREKCVEDKYETNQKPFSDIFATWH